MGSRFYFFTEPDKLDIQVAAQAFGPATPDPLTPGNDRYRITDTHPLTGGSADAVAVCDGILCAQKDGPNTLSLILKPSQAPPFESPVVSYFIYKGIDPASLLDPTGQQILDDTDPKSNDLTKTIVAALKGSKPPQTLSGSCAVLGLDRDADFQRDDGTKIFTDNDPIDRLFTYPHKTIELPPVAAGDVIGSFTASASFEIVLQRLGYKPKLALARHVENYISVLSLAANNNGTPWQPDDSAFFAHWHEKEQVLAYMDPCAYFGSFVQARLYKKSAGNADKIKGSDIYSKLLKTFFNRNIAYLDIRNNYSYSYNLFGLYDDTIRFVSHSDATLINNINFRKTLLPVQVWKWPILRLSIDDVPGANKRSLRRTMLSLPVGLSMAPAVLVSKGFATHLGPERAKFRTPALEPDTAKPGFYTPIRIAFPVTTDASQDVLSCSYTRINIYERTHKDPQPTAPLNIAGGDLLDGLFRLRDLQLDTDFAGNSLRFDVYPEEVLVDLGNDAGQIYAGAVGVAYDASQVTLFAFPNEFLLRDLNAGRTRAIASHPEKFASSSGTFQDWLTKSFPATKITRTTIKPGTPDEIDVVIARNRKAEARAKLTGYGQIKDYCFVLLMKPDHTSLLSAVASASGSPVFSRISNITPKVDPSANVPYIERTLQATNYQPDGSSAKVVKCDLAWSKSVIEYADF